MTENTASAAGLATSEMDLDDWLAGGSRNTQIVNLYARNSLFAEITQLESTLLPEKRTDVVDPDASAADFDDAVAHNARIRERLDELWIELDKSKREFRVAGRTEEEVSAIKAEIQVDLKAELTAAAAAGREAGKQNASRLGVLIPDEINRLVRASAMTAMAKIEVFELAVRTIAASTTVDVRGVQTPVSADQVRNMYRTLGEAQVSLLAQAASRTAEEVPEVTVPKS